jgi:hypothetical protein
VNRDEREAEASGEAPGNREGRRRATVPQVLFTRVLFTPEGCEELAARV